MADGTSKPIEDIQIGDEVFARPHGNPTGDLLKCKVVRTFTNEKETWSLTAENVATHERIIVRGTVEHPFYVQEKDWTSLGELTVSDKLISASGETLLVVAKEHHPETVKVYNFEVEQAHTYFVGKTLKQSLLVHNWCLFGEEFVMPWDDRASMKFGDNLSMYGRMGKRAVVGTASGAASGALTGAATGAVVGGTAGGIATGGAGILPGAGAITGAQAGAIGGGLTGFINAAMASPDKSSAAIAYESAIGGAASGVTAGALAPLAGASVVIKMELDTMVTTGGSGALALAPTLTTVATVELTPAVISGVSTGTGVYYAEMSRSGSGKSDPHGDGGRAQTKADKQIKDMEKKIEELKKQPGTSNEIIKLNRKIINVRNTANEKMKGETHWKRGK